MENNARNLSKTAVFALLFSVFSAAFILAPYWQLSGTGWIRYATVSVLIAGGIIWAIVASGDLCLPNISRRDIALFILLFAIMLALNFLPLTSVVPWRGDEDSHMWVTIAVANILKHLLPQLTVLFGLFLLSAVFFKRIGGKWYALVPVFAILIVAAGNAMTIQQEILLRYPFFTRFFHAVPLALTGRFFQNSPEIAYRIVPFLCSLILCFIFARNCSSRQAGVIPGFLYGLAAASTPLLFYYSSILYLEMPAVLLMTVVCINISRLLEEENRSELTAMPSWYALILIGFVKETTVVFLLTFVLVRSIVQVMRKRRDTPWSRFVMRESAVAVTVLFPFLLYFFFRSLGPVARDFRPVPTQIVDPELLLVTIKSLILQFGGLFAMFIAGLYILVRRRNVSSLLFIILFIVFETCFHLMDNRIYAGYSRFNLFLAAPVLAGSVAIAVSLKGKHRILLWLLPLAAIAAHFAISPITSDGTKKPGWGNYLCDISEHYYPYDKACDSINKRFGGRKILVTGMDYPYSFIFNYLNADRHDSVEVINSDIKENLALERCLKKASDRNFDLVLYHLLDNNTFFPDTGAGFIREQLYSNNAHKLVLFKRTDLQ